MRRRILLALALFACSRELALPAQSSLEISPVFASAAPREKLALSTSGGTGTRTFRFVQGGHLSGAGAAIDPVTGLYQAGADGSAQDVVEVADAAGARAQARIAVGPRLTVNPTVAAVAPGSTVHVAVGGGKPAYGGSLSP